MTAEDIELSDPKFVRMAIANEMCDVMERIVKHSEDACRSVERMLESWDRRIDVTNLTPSGSSYRWLEEGEAAAGQEMTMYHYNQLSSDLRIKAEAEYHASRWGFSIKDERPYFNDPQPLAFDPEESIKKPPRSDETSLADVWRDPLARTLWLAMKARHLTSQHFNGACVDQAIWLRKKPPKSPQDLHVSTGEGFCSAAGMWFNFQLFPYVVRILIDEGLWPFLPPPKDWVAPAVLSYTFAAKQG